MLDTPRVYVILAGNPDQRPVRCSAKTTRLIGEIARHPSQQDNIYFYEETPR